MATIRKRGSSWHAQVRRSGHPNLTRTFHKRADAETWARKIESEIDQGERPAERRLLGELTLADMLSRYRKTQTPTKRGSLQERYRLDRFIEHRLSRTTLANLTSVMVAAWRDERLATVQSGTVRRELALLHHVLEVARKEWSIPLPVNPVANVKMPPAAKPRTRRLENDELQRLLQGCLLCRGSMLRPIVLLAVETGMRRSELLNIRWADVDLQKRTLYIPLAKNGLARTVALTSKAIEVLAGVEQRGCDRVFPVSANAVRLAWERLKRRVGIDDLRFHDLRHEGVSRFFERGLSVPEVAALSGHRDFRMLLRYTHLRAEDIAAKLI